MAAVARLTNTASAFGRELDSLADVITFGVAPAVLAWMWGFRMLPLNFDPDVRARVLQLGGVATFVFLLAGAARLARFNIQVNPQPLNPGRPGRKYFVGMPIPAGAGAVAAVVHLVNGEPLQWWPLSIGWAVFVFVISFLMVSTWRFFSLKGVNFREQQNFRWLIGLGALIALIWFASQYALFVLALLYILSGVLARLSFLFRRRHGGTCSSARRGFARIMKNDPKTSPSHADAGARGGAFRLAIIGAATLKGRELKEVLSERNFPAYDIRLLDDEESLGQVDAVGDEPTFIQTRLARAPGERGLHVLHLG